MNGHRTGPRLLFYSLLLAVPLIAIGTIYWRLCWAPPTTILLIRHADRQGAADELSSDGLMRAQELAHVVGKSGISAIYRSEAVRTQQTAAPTAMLLGITPVVIPAADVSALADDIRANHTGQTVLVVEHSDNLPPIVAELGGPMITISPSEFDNLFVLSLCSCPWEGRKLTTLQYGAASQ